MNETLKKIAFLISVLIFLFFIIFVINQTAQVVELADKVSPKFGSIVFWTLLIVYAVLIFIYQKFVKLSGSPQHIPQYIEVPPNIEAKQIVSYFSTVVSY